MSGWLAYVALSVAYTWGGAVEIGVSPQATAWTCTSRSEFEVSPLELTWSPADGFGARSSVTVSQYVQRPIYCW